MTDLLGGYLWLALLSDGSIIRQIEEDGKENSVDLLRDKPVRELHLLPLNESTHKLIIIDIDEDEEWLKYWVRMNIGSDPSGEAIHIPAIDALALFPKKGHSSRKPVRMFVYPDGSIRVSTTKEP